MKQPNDLCSKCDLILDCKDKAERRAEQGGEVKACRYYFPREYKK
jgi:hypothetical protein